MYRLKILPANVVSKVTAKGAAGESTASITFALYGRTEALEIFQKFEDLEKAQEDLFPFLRSQIKGVADLLATDENGKDIIIQTHFPDKEGYAKLDDVLDQLKESLAFRRALLTTFLSILGDNSFEDALIKN